MAATKQKRRTQQERTEATTASILAAARSLFARHGYAGTSLDDVAAKAGVTKGAVYHHFTGKHELFRAVFEAEQEPLFAAVHEIGDRRSDPVRAGYEGFRAYLEYSLEPAVRQITLVDAPAVLGWDAIRAVDERYALMLVKDILRRGMESGELARRDVDALAHLLFGAMIEAAYFVARADDRDAAKRKVLREIKALLESLRA